MSAKRTWFGLILRALFPRFLFLGHGLMCIWLVVAQVGNTSYWYLAFFLGALLVEGVLNVAFRNGKEFHWFCPSAFLYCVVLIVSLTILREEEIKCLSDATTPYRECMRKTLDGSMFMAEAFNRMDSYRRASVVEQTGLLVLIVGRWLLPQGSISREQFAQILLIYVGTAADIVEFSEIYGEEYVAKLGQKNLTHVRNVLRGVMAVWSWSVLQFAMTIALPEEGLKQEEEEEEGSSDGDIAYFRSRMQNKVAPMSYMHYKSMLKQGFESSKSENSIRPKDKSRESEPTRQDFLRSKYELASSSLSRERSEIMETKRSHHNANKRSGMRISPSGTGSPLSNFRSPKENIDSPKLNVRFPKPSLDSPKMGNKRSPKISVDTPRTSQLHGKTSTTSPPAGNLSVGTRSGRKKKVSAWRFWGNESEMLQSGSEKRRDSTSEDNSLGIGKKDVQNCFKQHLDLFAIGLPVIMQDGPFFIFRLVLIVQYEVVTEMIILLSVKNFLVVMVIVYRILLKYCKEPQSTYEDGDEAAWRIKYALSTSHKISERSKLKDYKTSMATQAITHMQAKLSRSCAPGYNDSYVVEIGNISGERSSWSVLQQKNGAIPKTPVEKDSEYVHAAGGRVS